MQFQKDGETKMSRYLAQLLDDFKHRKRSPGKLLPGLGLKNVEHDRFCKLGRNPGQKIKDELVEAHGMRVATSRQQKED